MTSQHAKHAHFRRGVGELVQTWLFFYVCLIHGTFQSTYQFGRQRAQTDYTPYSEFEALEVPNSYVTLAILIVESALPCGPKIAHLTLSIQLASFLARLY